jgi:hypothetical protein
MDLKFAAINYRSIRDRIREQDPQIDEQTLADTVEGLSDLNEILTAIIRAALTDEALATGLKVRIADMQGRLDRLQDRAAKRRQIAKDVMVELDLKKIQAPDFTASIRPGMPALMVIDEAAVPSIYWEPRDPKLNRQGLLADLKGGVEITGAALSNPEPVLSVARWAKRNDDLKLIPLCLSARKSAIPRKPYRLPEVRRDRRFKASSPSNSHCWNPETKQRVLFVCEWI